MKTNSHFWGTQLTVFKQTGLFSQLHSIPLLFNYLSNSFLVLIDMADIGTFSSPGILSIGYFPVYRDLLPL